MTTIEASDIIHRRRRDFMSMGPTHIKCLHISENLWKQICKDVGIKMPLKETAEKGYYLLGYSVFTLVQPDIFEVIPDIGTAP